MDFSGISNVMFFISVCYVTVIASILTLIITEVYKKILTKKGKIYDGMLAESKDAILSKAGRIIALIVYSLTFFANEFILKKSLSFDGSVLTGLVTGGATTLGLSKGIYSALHQMIKKKSIFSKLESAESTIKELNAVITQNAQSLSSNETIEKVSTVLSDTKEIQENQKIVLSAKNS